MTADARHWERVYIFISSTFNDMHGERDYLVKRVFPQLADWCEARRLRMVDIDLRWGVTEQDATRNSNVVQVCLRRIDECRPFFICLLGQRYGWVPRKGDVSHKTFDDFPGLSQAVDEGRSVTELEILHAIAQPFATPGQRLLSEHALFYIRHPMSLRRLPRGPRQLRRTFTDTAEADPSSRAFLLRRRAQLRKATIAATGRPVATYRARWADDARTPELELPLRCTAILPENIERWRRQWQDAGVRVDGLDVAADGAEEAKARAFNAAMTRGRLDDFSSGDEPLAGVVLRDLQRAITARYPERASVWPSDPLSAELAQQEAFHFAAAEGFIERAGDFDALDAYVRGAVDHPFVLTAPAGAGKSMLLARWIDRVKNDVALPAGSTVHYRFIGASDRSTTITALLPMLTAELVAAGRIDELQPMTADQLRQMWPDLLARAASKTPLIIIIDALDQLQSGLNDLTWIPRRLPAGVRIIVSFRRDAPAAAAALERFQLDQAVMSEVRAFADEDDRRRLVKAYLASYLKELDDAHVDALIQTAGAANPLFLKIALTELRVFGAFANLATKIQNDFGTTPESAFDAVLRRLESDPVYSPVPPAIAVPVVFGLLAHARRGMAAVEMASILCKVTDTNPKDAAALQAATDAVHLLLRQMRPFLGRREGRFAFFYETFRIAALQRYTGDGSEHGVRPADKWHMLLADYFAVLPLWQTDGTTRRPTGRKVAELPYHLTMAVDNKRLAKTLTDLEFVEAKCSAGWTYDLLADYARVPSAMRTKAVDEFDRFIAGQAHVLARWPELAYQQAANTVLQDAEQSAPAKAASYRKVMGFESRPWIRRVNAGPEARAVLMTFVGHAGAVNSIAVSADGSRVISAGIDKTIRVWDAGTGSPIEVAAGVVDAAAVMAPIRGTTMVAVSGSDGQVALWDYDRLQLIRKLEADAANVTAMSSDRTGRWLAIGYAGATPAIVIDLHSGTTHDMGSVSPTGVSAIAIDGGGRLVRAFNQRIAIDDVLSRTRIAEVVRRGDRIDRVHFSPSGSMLASCAWGPESIQLHAAGDLTVTNTIETFQAAVYGIAFRPDESEIAAAGLDGTIRTFNLASGESTALLRGHTAAVLGIAYNADGSRLVSCGVDGTVRVWDPNSDRAFHQLARQRMKEQITRAGESTESAHRAVEGAMDLMLTVRKHCNLITGVALAASGRRAITASYDDTVRVWNFDSGTCERIFEGHEHGVQELAVNRGGTRAATTDRNGTIKVWDLEEGGEVASLHLGSPREERGEAALFVRLANEVERAAITPIAFAGDALVTADTRDRTLRLWDARGLKLRSTLPGHGGRVEALAASADGRHLISASSDGVLIAWDAAASKQTAIAEGFGAASGYVGQRGALAFSDDGHVVAAWSDGTVRILDAATLREIRTLRGSGGLISSLTTCGNLVGAARPSANGTIIDVWWTESNDPVFARRFGSQHVTVDLEVAGDRFATAGPAEPLAIWHLGESEPVHRFPESASCLAFHSGRIAAANSIGDVFLLEIMR